MFSPSTLFLIVAAAVALCSVDAWTATSSASSFGGRSLVTSPASQVVVVQNGSSMEMKKGKANVPPQMRGQYERQKQMNEMQQQMMAASKPGADGFPVFNLFVRTTSQKVRLFPLTVFFGTTEIFGSRKISMDCLDRRISNIQRIRIIMKC